MDSMTLTILLGVLVGVLVLFYLSEREKNSVRRKRKRRFSPQWTRDSDRKRDRRRKSKPRF